MDTIDSLTEKINNKTKNCPIFFITNDAERALGLEKLLSNYHIICIDDNDIVDYMLDKKVKVFCLEKELGKLNPIFRNSNRLLNHKLTQDYINNNCKTGNGNLMVFKIAPNLERSAKKMKFSILNTSSELNHKFELKLPQYESIKRLDIRIPDTITIDLASAEYKKLYKQLGANFILQFNRGHTGGGTIEIDSEARLEELKESFPQREVKIAKHIYGPAYTLNACITKQGTCWGGLSYQITGVEECTTKKAGTVGNDWLYPKVLDNNVYTEIDQFTKIIGKEMAKYGFVGMFGLDIVLDKNTNKSHIIEINARQPASIPMFSKLQLLKKQIPLNLLAIAEFLNIDYKIDIKKYNKEASSPFEAAQLFIRNKYQTTAEIIGGAKAGTYRVVGDNSAYDWSKGKPKLKSNVIITNESRNMPLVLKDEVYAIDGIKKGGMLILCSKEGKYISSNAEVARIQAIQSLLDKNGKLKAWTQEIIKGLNKYIVLKQLSNDRKTT